MDGVCPKKSFLGIAFGTLAHFRGIALEVAMRQPVKFFKIPPCQATDFFDKIICVRLKRLDNFHSTFF